MIRVSPGQRGARVGLPEENGKAVRVVGAWQNHISKLAIFSQNSINGPTSKYHVARHRQLRYPPAVSIFEFQELVYEGSPLLGVVERKPHSPLHQSALAVGYDLKKIQISQ